MSVDRSSTPAQGKRSYELATLYKVARTAAEAADKRKYLGGGLARVDPAAELRARIELDRVRDWLRNLDAERARASAGDGSEG